jgi:nucleoside-diphosphate-sugar epimerase
VRVLVTGAGLVGCHAAAELLEAGHEPILLDARPQEDYVRTVAGDVPVLTADIGDVEALDAVLASARLDAVVHTAGLIGQKVARRPELAFQVNVGGTVAVAEAAAAAGARRLVLTSSVAVYDWARAAPERPLAEAAAVGPRSLYGASKLAAETAAQAVAARAGLELVVLRLAGIYGFGSFRGGSQLGPLLERALLAARDGTPLVLPPELDSLECLYVCDAARAIRLALEAERPASGVYNVGTGRVHSSSELAAALRELFPLSQVEAPEPGRPAQPPLGVGLAQAELDFVATWSLVDGLAEFAEALAAARPAAPARILERSSA